MKFKTKGQLNDHEHRHSNIRPFKCEICNSAFNRKTRLKVHMMIHTGEKPFQCTYPKCCKRFREKGNLNSHMKKHFKKVAPMSPSHKASSSKSTTSYYNDVEDIFDKILENENIIKGSSSLNMFSLNILYEHDNNVNNV